MQKMWEKKRTKKRGRPAARVLTVLSALVLTVSLAACDSTATGNTSTPTGTDTLRVGVRADVSRFGYFNTDAQKYSGLEIDIAQEMADRLGYSEIEFVTTTPDTKEVLLSADEIDCVVACFSLTEARAENFDFSPAYYEDASIVVVENSTLFTDITDLAGCTFGTISNSNATTELADRLTQIGFTDGIMTDISDDGEYIYFDNFRIRQMQTYRELSDALEEGTIDAFCADHSISYTYVTDDRSILDFEIKSQSYCVASQKDSPLSQPISETIQAMLDDGTIARLIDKWD